MGYGCKIVEYREGSNEKYRRRNGLLPYAGL